MVFLFAPLVALLLGDAAITVPWDKLLISVVLYIVVPVIVAQILRNTVLRHGGQSAHERLLAWLGPDSIVLLHAPLVPMFGFQGQKSVTPPLVIALTAVQNPLPAHFQP